MKINNFHINFKLNGISFTNSDELIIYSEKEIPLISDFLQDWFSDVDFIIVKTSGSTGKPKEIKIKKKYMKNSAKMTGEFFILPKKTTALLCLSTDYIAGKMMLVRALTLGWHLDVVAPTSNPLENTAKNYNFSAFVPLQLENSLDKINQIKKLIVGGGKVSKSLQEKIQSVKTAIFATYGMTETVTHIAVKRLKNFNIGISSLSSSLKTGSNKKSHFKILPNINIKKDNRNCLIINAPKLSDETIITNDIVDLISDTEFKLLGRFDNVINSGGVKLHPEIIEDKLATIIKSQFFVAGISDEKLGEKLVLVVENSSEIKTFLSAKIKKLNSLSKFEKPKEIYFLSDFLVTETGKIRRKENLELLNLE